MHATDITYHQKSRLLDVTFDDGSRFQLPSEYLRVFSPSAEVRGHGLAEPVLITGKEDITISGINPVGHYAIQLVFADGHNSGIYSWEFLHDLGVNHAANWQRYQQRLAAK